jgi:hypothetical protein
MKAKTDTSAAQLLKLTAETFAQSDSYSQICRRLNRRERGAQERAWYSSAVFGPSKVDSVQVSYPEVSSIVAFAQVVRWRLQAGHVRYGDASPVVAKLRLPTSRFRTKQTSLTAILNKPYSNALMICSISGSWLMAYPTVPSGYDSSPL